MYEEEGRLVKALSKYIETSVQNGTTVEHRITEFVEHIYKQRSVVDDPAEWVRHPVNAFRILLRVAEQWEDVFGEIVCDECPHTYAATGLQISKKIVVKTVGFWPTEIDVHGAVRGLIRLWRVYKLDLPLLFNGTILHKKTHPLSWREIFTVAKGAVDMGMFYDGITWMTSLLEVNDRGQLPVESRFEEGTLRRTLASAYYQGGMPWKAVEVLEKGDQRERGINFEFYKTSTNALPKGTRHTEMEAPKHSDKYLTIYEALCRGPLKSPKAQSKLKCYMKETRVKFIRIKTEVVNIKPIIVIYHDVISRREIDVVRQQANGSLAFSQIYTGSGHSFVTQSRVSQTAWLKDTDNPVLMRLNRRIASVTGLDTTFREHLSSVERYQVVNYGLGGEYGPHNDHVGKPLWVRGGLPEAEEITDSGDRIATWMFYLSPVTAGGATVFPLLKARVPVTEGSAVFWYNMFPNGSANSRMMHAGCPVLLGNKWVANKWIRQHGQVLRTLCGTTEKAHFKLENI